LGTGRVYPHGPVFDPAILDSHPPSGPKPVGILIFNPRNTHLILSASAFEDVEMCGLADFLCPDPGCIDLPIWDPKGEGSEPLRK
jgi:hypothetical protein